MSHGYFRSLFLHISSEYCDMEDIIVATIRYCSNDLFLNSNVLWTTRQKTYPC